MQIIAKNTTTIAIELRELGYVLLPGASIDLVSKFTLAEISNCDDLFQYVSNGQIVINNGVRDLKKVAAIRYLLLNQETITQTSDGKLLTQETSRALNTTTYFEGAGDDPSIVDNVGGGSPIYIHHFIGDTTAAIAYMYLNCLHNETWIHEGYITWKDAEYDNITIDVVADYPTIEPANGTPYDIYNGLIVPTDSTGTIAITSDLSSYHGGLVEIFDDSIPKFWNADWNSDTQKFENITPAPLGNGKYNIFANEVILYRVINKCPLLGTGFQRLQTADSKRLGHGMHLKITTNTNVSIADHEWGASFLCVFHRAKTI